LANAVSLEPPDVLYAELPENPLCLITDDGSSLTPVLAKALSKQGWSLAILRFSGISALAKKKRKPFAKEIPLIELSSSAESELETSLKSLTEKRGNIGGFIHLHPASSAPAESKLEDGANAFLKQAFLTAKNVCTFLNEAGKSDSSRSHFLAVAHLDGELGMGSGQFGAVGSGLSGLIKTAGVEWPDVY